jgi:replicative DNA helicase
MDNTQDTLQKYGTSFQSKIISALLTDAKFLGELDGILLSKFFESDANKWIVDSIIDYYDIFKTSPTLDVFKVKVSKLENEVLSTVIITQLKHIYTEIDTVDVEYVKSEFKSFCINQNLKEVILQSVDLLKLGNYDKIKDLVDEAIKVGAENNLGLDYITDYVLRMTESNRKTVETPWDVITDLMDGGLSGGELAVVVAPSGVGKTWILTAIGAFAVLQGLNVAHYSLELSEHYVGMRYDTVFTQIPSNELKDADKAQIVQDKISSLKGNLQIKYFPPKGISTRNIQQHIEKLTMTGNKPDLVIIDYADLLLSHTNKSDSTYQEQGGVYIELRGLSGEIGVPIWTASQTNRSAIDSEVIEADKIADSYAKVMNADFIMSWSRKTPDKVNNTARAHIMKNRFGPDGITFPCKMDTNTGFIEIYDGNTAAGILSSKEASSGKLVQKELLHKKYLDTMG